MGWPSVVQQFRKEIERRQREIEWRQREVSRLEGILEQVESFAQREKGVEVSSPKLPSPKLAKRKWSNGPNVARVAYEVLKEDQGFLRPDEIRKRVMERIPNVNPSTISSAVMRFAKMKQIQCSIKKVGNLNVFSYKFDPSVPPPTFRRKRSEKKSTLPPPPPAGSFTQEIYNVLGGNGREPLNAYQIQEKLGVGKDHLDPIRKALFNLYRSKKILRVGSSPPTYRIPAP